MLRYEQGLTPLLFLAHLDVEFLSLVHETAGSVPLGRIDATVGNQIWAAPLRTDAGLLYYRKDHLSTPPQTWEDLTTQARLISRQGLTRFGYVWQDIQYEGLVCDFMEVLYSYGTPNC